MPAYVLVALIAALIFSELAFITSLVLKDASIADVFWGIYFIVIAAVFLAKNDKSTIQYIVTYLVAVWAIRITWHIGRRNLNKPEDWRYAKDRRKWGHSFFILSYLKHFFFQAILAVVISASVIVAASASPSYNTLHWWQYLGILVWLKGFVFESVSDFQLVQFLKKNPAKGEVMKTGLWKYSRHPNYFGEILQWWGIWLLVLGLPYSWWALVSPLTITILLVFVSGIPMLEKRYKNIEQYQKYAKKTSILVPLPAERS
jgi:steroid 5-alpha reductase family enzyme